MNGAQLELPLSPHDGTPHSFLLALRWHLDGFNPDRHQVEKRRHAPAILTALQKLRALDYAAYRAARALFPELCCALDQWEPMRENGPQPGVAPDWFLSWQEPLFPLLVPTLAPSAPGARGTPVSAFSLRLPCNRGLTPTPPPGACRSGSALFLRHQGQ